ncbi:MAG: hypothetical protein KBC33_03950 [Candidatus Pacebacteria bacterium]|nr:hypothetical protein [Candidatus Paceibacterota bacterium]
MSTKNKITQLRLIYPVEIPLEHEDAFFEKVAYIRASLDEVDGVVVKNQEDVDCYIVLLEHYPDSFVKEIVELCQGDRAVVCFMPRGLRAPELILDEIRLRNTKQSVYLYDDPDEIRRTIEYKLKDSVSRSMFV